MGEADSAVASWSVITLWGMQRAKRERESGITPLIPFLPEYDAAVPPPGERSERTALVPLPMPCPPLAFRAHQRQTHPKGRGDLDVVAGTPTPAPADTHAHARPPPSEVRLAA